MMSQIPCKQSIRIKITGWFKHYFPGNLRRNILFKVCNYTSYQNLQKNSLPNPFAHEKAGDKAGTVSAHAAQKTQWTSALIGGLNINIPVRLSNCMCSYRIQQDDTKKDM